MISNCVDKVQRNPWTAVVSEISKDGTTAKVSVPRVVVNERYGKRQKLKTVLHVDTSGKSVRVGDTVKIVPCRKLSRMKSWRVLEVSVSQG